MLKFITLFSFFSVILSASSNFAMVFDVQKGAKKLGTYEISLEKEKLSSHSTGVTSKIKLFISKEISYLQDGHKRVVFIKNKRQDSFEVRTKLSAFNDAQKKEYARKLKKVKHNDMLLLTKTGKKRIELFNKRKIVIKTLDEVLADIVNKKATYTNFILFEKSGVMKMIARLDKKGTTYTIVNKTKKKGYIEIDTKNSIPQKVFSLVSKWKLTLVQSGNYEVHTLALKDTFDAKTLLSGLENATLKLHKKIKTTKKYYSFKADVTLYLGKDVEGKKSYEKAKVCKQLLKKAKVKHKKLSINVNECKTVAIFKLHKKKHNKKVKELLEEKYPQLKSSKNIQFTKSNVKYKLL